MISQGVALQRLVPVQPHDELGGAPARDPVALAHVRLQDRGHVRDARVARPPSVPLGHGLDPVDGHERELEAVQVALRARDLLGEALFPRAAVVEAGELVRVRHALEAVDRLVQLPERVLRAFHEGPGGIRETFGQVG